MIYQFSKHDAMKIIVPKDELDKASIPVDLFINYKEGYTDIPVFELLKSEHAIVEETETEISFSFVNDNLFAVVVREWHEANPLDS